MVLYGYGKILNANLSTRKLVINDIEPQFARQFIGGLGFSCKILYDEVGIDVDPLGPQNIIIFANGPLTGTQAPCSGRTEITTKHPMTGNIGTGNTGGLWGTRLKRAGFDLVIIRGESTKPVYLWIDDNNVELREADHLWGKDTAVTSDNLSRELDPAQPSSISVLAIGPAGENLVKYACPVNDYHHVAARSGAGAVMGAKKLKAIAVRGTGKATLAKSEEFAEAATKARERVLAAGSGMSRESMVTSVHRDGCLPAKNFQTGFLPQWLETRSRDIAKKHVTRLEGTCYACPTSCFMLTEVTEGKYAGTKAGRGVAGGVVFDWGAKCAIENLPAIWKCKQLCHQHGMDYGSAAGSISFAMELWQRGIISAQDTKGLELSWGNEDAVIGLLLKIASREGFGNVLAEGSVRAAKIIGRGAEQYLMTIKGMELMTVSDPRAGSRGFHFGELINPRGGDNLKDTHGMADRYNANWWVDKFDMFADVKAKVYSVSSEEISRTWEGKPLMSRWFEDLYSAASALGLCLKPIGASRALGPTYLSRLFSTCTGWDITPEELMEYGETIFTVFKSYAVRQGLTRKDDTWPNRFFEEPLLEGPAKGAILSRETIAQLLDEYYQLRGWDKTLGIPTREKLVALGLGEIADELAKLSGKNQEQTGNERVATD